MNEPFKEKLLSMLENVDGNVGFYCKSLTDGDMLEFNADLCVESASVIKIPIMIEAYRRSVSGLLSLDDEHILSANEKVPPSGVLTFLKNGTKLTIKDLITLMIIVSDNTATNILIDIVGMENVNDTLKSFGAVSTRLRRKMCDFESIAKGITNTVSAREIGNILEKLYLGEVVSEEASGEMINILTEQQNESKIPFFLSDNYSVLIAHKTGENTGVTHDVGIVFGENPILLCFLGENVNVPEYNRVIQDASRLIVEELSIRR